MSDTPVCRQCSADAHVTRITHAEGQDRDVWVSFDGLPVLECENGHKRLLTADFALRFIESLLASDDLAPAPPSVKKGLFKKHLHCPACGSELPASEGKEGVGHSRVELADSEPVTVEVHLPVYGCPACQKSATLPADLVQREVMSAVAAAFEKAGITPG